MLFVYCIYAWFLSVVPVLYIYKVLSVVRVLYIYKVS